jgi:hypothetical protein
VGFVLVLAGVGGIDSATDGSLFPQLAVIIAGLLLMHFGAKNIKK